jgi:hypothetical protein
MEFSFNISPKGSSPGDKMRIRKATASDYPHIKKLSDELTRLEQAYENITYDEEDIEIPG